MTENFTGRLIKVRLNPKARVIDTNGDGGEFVLGHKCWSMIKGNLKSLKNTVSFLKLKLCSIK